QISTGPKLSAGPKREGERRDSHGGHGCEAEQASEADGRADHIEQIPTAFFFGGDGRVAGGRGCGSVRRASFRPAAGPGQAKGSRQEDGPGQKKDGRREEGKRAKEKVKRKIDPDAKKYSDKDKTDKKKDPDKPKIPDPKGTRY